MAHICFTSTHSRNFFFLTLFSFISFLLLSFQYFCNNWEQCILNSFLFFFFYFYFFICFMSDGNNHISKCVAYCKNQCKHNSLNMENKKKKKNKMDKWQCNKTARKKHEKPNDMSYNNPPFKFINFAYCLIYFPLI